MSQCAGGSVKYGEKILVVSCLVGLDVPFCFLLNHSVPLVPVVVFQVGSILTEMLD